jgi:hypothetical protein
LMWNMTNPALVALLLLSLLSLVATDYFGN